jgi:hypothetical protein
MNDVSALRLGTERSGVSNIFFIAGTLRWLK